MLRNDLRSRPYASTASPAVCRRHIAFSSGESISDCTPHADTVYACSAPCSHLVLRHIVGIYLDSKFPGPSGRVPTSRRRAAGTPQQALATAFLLRYIKRRGHTGSVAAEKESARIRASLSSESTRPRPVGQPLLPLKRNHNIYTSADKTG